ncbi:hypothetical protein GNY06_06665 [Elizabethkingia argentiflava]|uniref:Glycosyltransferase family 1 protein n=1 Tax=Elizabethkingia argenteiflava TaxID=2681556 RepID=A0A845PTC8_9FLAO|nr:long-chain fatty acid--CoA ligase [Elizabethkingia argenteiflava]NAW51064.1 hypothetical protein [Elizabethkingia argenteiflava]
MKKIAYIELDTHAELAVNFIELTRDINFLHIDYFFSRKVSDRINEGGNNIYIAEASDLLKKLEGRRYDAIIIGTAHRYFNVFEEVARNYTTFIIAHNLNFIKASKTDLFRSIFKKDMAYRLKLWFKEGLFRKDRLYSLAKFLFVVDENMYPPHYPYRLEWLPLLYTKYSSVKADPERVVIAGTVDQHRRNYRRIFNKIKYFKGNFIFTFLGRAQGKELHALQDLSQSLPKHIEIEYYDTRVSRQEFEQKIQQAGVLWCPIQKGTSFFSIAEIYGKTKMSGNIGDAIKYAKPAIFPSSYLTDYSFIFKERRDIEKQISDLKNKIYDFDSFKKELVKRKLGELLRNL